MAGCLYREPSKPHAEGLRKDEVFNKTKVLETIAHFYLPAILYRLFIETLTANFGFQVILFRYKGLRRGVQVLTFRNLNSHI
jgi:hypothetical protein